MPPEYLLVKIEYIGETERRLSFEPQGERYIDMIEMLKEKSPCTWR